MLNLLITCVFCLVLASFSLSQAAQPEKGFGINVNFVKPNDTPYFLDVFKSARDWQSHPHDQNSNPDEADRLDLDDKGWIRSLKPGQTASKNVYATEDGLHILSYDGKGELKLDGVEPPMKREQNGDIIFKAKANSKIELHILKTDPQDYIRNISLVHQNHHKTYQELIFHPAYLDYIAPFRSIRFMNWNRVNVRADDVNTRPLNWQDRITVNHASQATPAGVAVEYMIALANQSNKSAWFSLPHLATDAYVRHMAERIKEKLKPDLKVYVELSNEVWNPSFGQHHFMVAQAAQKAPRGIKALFQDKPNWVDAYLNRSAQVFAIFNDVFEGDDRLIKVLAGQFGQMTLTEDMLSHDELLEHVDVFAVAPYFGFSITNEMTTDQVFDALDQELKDLETRLGDVQILVKKAGLELIAYEAGQHIMAPTATNPDKSMCEDLNINPKMGDIYQKYLEIWDRVTGGQIMFLYHDVKKDLRFGCWGLSRSFFPPFKNAPKYQAVVDYIKDMK